MTHVYIKHKYGILLKGENFTQNSNATFIFSNNIQIPPEILNMMKYSLLLRA